MYDTINSRIENTATCHQEIDEFGWNYSRVKQNYKTCLEISLKLNGWFNMQENDQLWWSIFDGIRKFFQVGRKDNSSFYRWCSIFRFFDLWQFAFHQNKLKDMIGYSSFDYMHLSSNCCFGSYEFDNLKNVNEFGNFEQVGKFVKTRFNQVWKSGIQNHRSPILGNSKTTIGEYILGEDQLLKMKSPQVMSGKPGWGLRKL